MDPDHDPSPIDASVVRLLDDLNEQRGTEFDVDQPTNAERLEAALIFDGDYLERGNPEDFFRAASVVYGRGISMNFTDEYSGKTGAELLSSRSQAREMSIEPRVFYEEFPIHWEPL